MPEKLGSYRKDIQWISGLIFVILLMLGFFVGGIQRFFAPETAKPAVAAMFKDTLVAALAQNYDQTKVWLQSRPATEPLDIPGIPKIGLTAGEAAQLDARALATRISTELAGRIYEGDLDSFAPQYRQSLGPLVYFRRATYEPLQNAARGFAGISAVFGFIMVLCGRRFGRIYSLGLALSAAGLFPAIVYNAAESALRNQSSNAQAAAGMAALTAALKPALEAGQDSVNSYLALGSLLMFSAVVGRSIHWLATRDRSAGAWAVHQTGALELKLPYDKAFDMSLASLGSVKAIVREHDRSGGTLVAKTGFSWKSPGETIEIDVTRISPEKTRIQLSSKMTMGITILDTYGKNLENISRLTAFLKREEDEYKSREPANIG